MKCFENLWQVARDLGMDQKDLAEELYNKLVAAKVPESIVETVIYVLYENYALHQWIDDNNATNDDLKLIKVTIAHHKHLPNGKAVEEL